MNKSLGFVTVTTAATPVRCTANEGTPSADLFVHSYLVEAASTNLGKIWIGTATMNKSTGAGVYGILAPPSSTTYPSFSSNIVGAANAFPMQQIYLDADNSGEKALVSVVIA